MPLYYRRRPLCSLVSHLKNAKMLRHTPNSELLFLLIEKGPKAKNWAQCLPRGFMAALQAKLRGEPEERWPAHPEAAQGSQGGGNWNTSSSHSRAKARDGKWARERPSESPFLKSFHVNILANLSLCTFWAHSWSSCS